MAGSEWAAAIAAKSCEPCRGDTVPMTAEQALRYLESLPSWILEDSPMRIQRRFAFKNFAQALAFVNRVGAIAEAEDHHPEIRFGWGYCEIEIFTHSLKGLHENDFILAAKIDALQV